MSHMKLPLSLAVAGALLVGACGEPSDLPLATNQAADEYLEPTYAASNEAIQDVVTKTMSLCDTRSEPELDAAQDAWRTAQIAWKSTQAGWMGPTTVDRFDSEIGYEETSASGIEETIAGSETLNPEFVRESLPTTQKGLGAVEYMLFTDVSLDDRRCDYLVAVASVLGDDSSAVNKAWFESWSEGPSYLDRFRGVGDPSMVPAESLGAITKGVIELTKLLTVEQVGQTLGLTAPSPILDSFPEGPAEYGLLALQAQIAGIDAAYGRAPTSMSGAISNRDEAVDAEIRTSIDALTTTIDQIIEESQSTSYSAVLDSHHDELVTIYDNLIILLRIFRTDVVSLLDVTLGFSDSDGDTG